MQNFILELIEKNEVMIVRGNHEDLMMDLLHGWESGSYLQYHHHANGTINTVLQLTRSRPDDLVNDPDSIRRKLLGNPCIQVIIPGMLDYYETDHYIFTHGWIPCKYVSFNPYSKEYISIEDWRKADMGKWSQACWINGMEAAHGGVIEKGKTIVCGHWHVSFGHSHYEGDGGEFDHHPNFMPYYGEGIIALDACTPISGKINCIVIED